MPLTINKAFIQKLEASPIDVLKGLSREDVVEILEAASDAYYNSSSPLLKDDVFDIVKDYLRQKDPKNKFFVRIGAPVKGEKVELPFWMGSMDKIRDDPKQLEKWKGKHTGSYVISDKLDGNSAMLVYSSDGVRMYSRGDGEYGQDISHLLTYIQHVPKASAIKTGTAVRGELIISKGSWDKIKHLGANARNIVAGTMNAKRTNPEIARSIEFVAYEMLKPRESPATSLALLKDMGFHVVHHEVLSETMLTMPTLSDILMRRRKDSPYEIDGVIVEHNELHKRIKGKNPSYAFAFKSILTHDEAEVIVHSVEWNVSKDGYIKPTVIFDPVIISGVTIQRATGFNGSFIEKNVIGPGSRIVIIRSGDVIPHVVRVLTPAASKKASMPDMDYEWTDTHVDIRIKSGATSDEMERKRIEHFVKTLEVKNVATGTLRKLYENGFDTIPKLLNITEADVLKIDGFKQASAKRIVEGFQKIKESATCIDLMVASNIFGRGLGMKKMELLIREIPSILQKQVPTLDRLLKVEGIGKATAESFLQGISKFFVFMNEIGIPCRDPNQRSKPVSETPKSKKGPSFEGMTVVFTGFRNKDWEALVTSSGGKVSSSVSKNTTLLVASDPSEKSTKITKARELGIKIVSKEEFAKTLA